MLRHLITGLFLSNQYKVTTKIRPFLFYFLGAATFPQGSVVIQATAEYGQTQGRCAVMG